MPRESGASSNHWRRLIDGMLRRTGSQGQAGRWHERRAVSPQRKMQKTAGMRL